MTIFEITRYIPLGSRVTISEWDPRKVAPDPKKEHRGIVTGYHYGTHGAPHTVTLEESSGTRTYPAAGIAHIKIEGQPVDFDTNVSGTSIDQAAWTMTETVREYMKYMTPSMRQQLDLEFQTEFPAQTACICSALDRAGIPQARAMIEHWKGLSFDKWQALFQALYQARIAAEESGDPDARYLRQAEAYICCRGRKENCFIYEQEDVDPIAYAISLLVRNLVSAKARIREEDTFSPQNANMDLALDWYLLALCYHRSGAHTSCAYVALVQSILSRGCFLTHPKNRQTFMHLCGNAHDFTFLRHLLEHSRHAKPAQSMDELKAFGNCICWMMYQMGGSGILDAADLLVSIQGCTPQSLSQLRERALAYVYKFMPRNRNDRYMAITDAMRQLLIRLAPTRDDIPDDVPAHQHDALLEDMQTTLQDNMLDGSLLGYLYEFHGESNLPVSSFDGFILGQDFLSYRISYPADSYNRLPVMIQAKSARTRQTGERAVFAVRFYPSPAGMLYRYQADSEFEFEQGGLFDL